MTPRLLKEYEALLTGRWLTDMANSSAFFYYEIKDINWVGFYLLSDGKLWLGPFQGKPACTEIQIGRGVCGTAIQQKKTQIVGNVHEFPGHITCDPASQSEVVVPLIAPSGPVGVLDVDSASLNRFSSEDAQFFETCMAILLSKQTSFSC
jgi:GAF domain-containing protein